MRAAGELRPRLVALFRAPPEVSAAFPAALDEKEQGWRAGMPFRDAAGLLLGNTARRAQGLRTSLLPLGRAGEARVSSAPLPPGATRVPAGSARAPNLKGQTPTATPRQAAARRRREWVALSRHDAPREARHPRAP